MLMNKNINIIPLESSPIWRIKNPDVKNRRFKNNIKYYRKLYDLSIVDLSNYLGVTRATYYNLEKTNKPNIRFVYMLAELYLVDIKNLFNFDYRKEIDL